MGKRGWKTKVLLIGNWRGATSVLLSNDRHHIVVDTGMPHAAHQLIRALEKQGLRPEDIHIVINTHFHVDHVLNNSLFPNSVIYAMQQSYEWCRALYADLRDQAAWEKLILRYYPETFDYEQAGSPMAKLRKIALRWWDPKRLGRPSQLRWVETEPLPEGLEGVITCGHVPGHLSILVRAGDPPTVIAGDAVLSREENSPILTMIPQNREQFRRDRARLLSLGGRILPGHDREFSLSIHAPSEAIPR